MVITNDHNEGKFQKKAGIALSPPSNKGLCQMLQLKVIPPISLYIPAHLKTHHL